MFSSYKSHQGESVGQKRQADGSLGSVTEEGEAHRGAGVGADPAGEEDDVLGRDIFLSFPGHSSTSVSWQLSTGQWRREKAS